MNRQTRGRRNCSRCGRWRQIVTDFYPHQWIDGEVAGFHSECKACAKKRSRQQHQSYRKRRLPVEPLSKWIKRNFSYRGGLADLSRTTGLDWSQLKRYRDKVNPEIQVGTVDRILVHTDTHLQDLYPNLYS